jgi:ATP adenylyltransferase
VAKHDQLWAPWRMAYIQGESTEKEVVPENLLPGADPDCFICQAVAETDLHRRHVVRKSEHCLTLLNRYPYNNGHLLVAPRRHCARLDELNGPEQCELVAEIARMVSLLEKVICPQGFNIGLNLGQVAGAGLPGHLHWHIVPRWSGDTNFMPALAAVKVIPQALDTLWEALTEELSQCPK